MWCEINRCMHSPNDILIMTTDYLHITPLTANSQLFLWTAEITYTTMTTQGIIQMQNGTLWNIIFCCCCYPLYFVQKELHRANNAHRLPSDHFTSSLVMRYLKLKLCGIHSMVFLDFATSWHFLTLFLRDSGRDSWIISITPLEHKPESLVNVSTSFGTSIFGSLRTPKLARMYSTFATSSSWNTLFGVYTRTCQGSFKRKDSSNRVSENLLL